MKNIIEFLKRHPEYGLFFSRGTFDQVPYISKQGVKGIPILFCHDTLEHMNKNLVNVEQTEQWVKEFEERWY